jgi:hypothetical protein
MKNLEQFNESSIQYEVYTNKGKLDVIIERDEEGDTFFIVKDFNHKVFLITDFEQFKSLINYYQNINPYPLLSIELMKELNVGETIVEGYSKILKI